MPATPANCTRSKRDSNPFTTCTRGAVEPLPCKVSPSRVTPLPSTTNIGFVERARCRMFTPPSVEAPYRLTSAPVPWIETNSGTVTESTTYVPAGTSTRPRTTLAASTARTNAAVSSVRPSPTAPWSRTSTPVRSSGAAAPAAGAARDPVGRRRVGGSSGVDDGSDRRSAGRGDAGRADQQEPATRTGRSLDEGIGHGARVHEHG